MSNNGKILHEPKTAFGRYMVYTFIPKYSNNVMGLVYVGAAILIIIVGLRGLGTVAGELAIVPGFMLQGQKISPNWVMFALVLEFFLLMVLATVTFFTPEDMDHHSHQPAEAHNKAAGHQAANLKADLEQIKSLTDEEVKMIEGYLEKFAAISNKINKIQMNSMQALNSMKEAIKN